MLVLGRKAGQAVMLGEEIRVVVVQVEGDQVKLAIEAPREVPIYREEVYQSIRQSNLGAVTVADRDAAHLAKMLKARLGAGQGQ